MDEVSESLKETIKDYIHIYSAANDEYRNNFSGRRDLISESHEFAMKVMELEKLNDMSNDIQYALGMSFGK